MGKSAAKSIRDTLKIWDGLVAADGRRDPGSDRKRKAEVLDPALVDRNTLPIGNKAYLDGNLARRVLPVIERDHVIWDIELAGFGLRIHPSGRRIWFVRRRRRGKHQRITLGSIKDIDAATAREHARRLLSEVALEGLPQRTPRKVAPVFSVYVEEFWRDCARHWKPSTQLRNRSAVRSDLMPHFGNSRLDAISRADIVRWRDSCAEGREAKFNRALPVLASMLKYAEQLGYMRKGANPCRGMPRFRRKAIERFLSVYEYRRLGECLAMAEQLHPGHVAIVKLLLYTGARKQEIAELRWDWVQIPRLVLPDSKTGSKTIWLCRQAVGILESLPRIDGEPLVFPNPRRSGPIHIDMWWSTFRRSCALPDLRIHDLRHSYASIAILNKVALATVGKLLGHELPETTAKYAHLADDAIVDAAMRVSGGLARAIGLGQ